MKYLGSTDSGREIFVDISAFASLEIFPNEPDSCTTVTGVMKSGHPFYYEINGPMRLVVNRILQK